MNRLIKYIVEREETAEMPGREYPLIRCDCGASVHCFDSWANECDRCGTEYNRSGQQLSPRQFWGEETGEHFA